jgi:chorismate dehydratase
MNEPVRIGYVRYLNTTPLVEGLDAIAGVKLVPTVPSRIADLVVNDEVDVGLVSLIDAVRSTVPLTLLPVGMIGCDGPTLTVRLYSGVPIERVTRVHADTDSHTSIALCRLLLKRRFGLTPQFVDFDVRERATVGGAPEEAGEWPQTLLMIGDKVVTGSPPAVRYPHQLDLGEAWKSLTGLPFVYAMWMARSDRMDDRAVQTAAGLLDRQLRHNLTRLDWIISTRAPDHRWPADLARRYIGELLRYRVGNRERQAAELFIAMASQEGIAPAGGLRWMAPGLVT